MPETTPVYQAQFRHYTRRVTIMFVALTLVSCAAAYWSWHEGEAADEGIAALSRDAVYRSCASRADLRVTVAQAVDDLRRFAVADGGPNGQRKAFFKRTAPPIDDLLSGAAGHRIRTQGSPLDRRVLDEARKAGHDRCYALALRFRLDRARSEH